MRTDALKTDLYELTMAAGYFRYHPDTIATFELSCRSLPPERNYLVACGLRQIVDYLLNLRFSDEDISFLKDLPVMKDIPGEFFESLKTFRFSGDVWAMPEGEIYFAGEPVMQVTAPIIEAQIVETYLLSMMNIQSLVATKASRVVQAAGGINSERKVVDFGSRRAHGPQAGVFAARAAYLAGCAGTSNVYAGRGFDIPLYGTIAHSWVESFVEEDEAFEKYADGFPENLVLLVDTYDTLEAVKRVTQASYKDRVKAVRLDSGDLKQLSRESRRILDGAGMKDVRIIASGNLNEDKIDRLCRAGAPINVFGVGTEMVVSRDCPALDLTYKLMEVTDGQGNTRCTLKKSPEKQTLPGRKQVYRREENGKMTGDIIAFFDEPPPPKIRPLLQSVIEKGSLSGDLPGLKESRQYLARQIACLDTSFLDLTGSAGYDVSVSQSILDKMETLNDAGRR